MIGHIKQQRFFRTAIAAQQLSHAYIFSGAEGIGKRTFANALARGLLCENHRYFADCDCPSCRQIAEEAHPDYYIYDDRKDSKDKKLPEYALSIENTRKVADISAMTAYAGGWKVVIFDGAHILCQAGADAANALLKTLEEPGQATLFILITNKLNRILPTIQSRCQLVHFDPLTEPELRQVLRINNMSEDMAEFAGGSVSQAAMMAEIDYKLLSAALKNRRMADIAPIVLGAGSKDKLAAIARILQQAYIKRYKESATPEHMVLVQYLSEFLNNLEYNVNVTIATADLYVKLAELGQGA